MDSYIKYNFNEGIDTIEYFDTEYDARRFLKQLKIFSDFEIIECHGMWAVVNKDLARRLS